MATSIRHVSEMTADKVKFRGKGISATVAFGTSQNIDYKLTEARLIDGVSMILNNHVFGDSVKFQVVDVDNILGYGSGVVLDTFGDTWYVVSDSQAQGEIRLPYSAEILANLYIRIVYTSTGSTNVDFRCNLFLHTYSA